MNPTIALFPFTLTIEYHMTKLVGPAEPLNRLNAGAWSSIMNV